MKRLISLVILALLWGCNGPISVGTSETGGGPATGLAAVTAPGGPTVANPLPVVEDDDTLGHLIAEDDDQAAREFIGRGVNRGAASLKHPCTADGDDFSGIRYFVFHSGEALIPGDSNDKDDIYLRDYKSGCLTRVSLGPDNAQANGNSHEATISRDGRYVAFRSSSTNLVDGDGNSSFDIFVRDLQTGTTTRVSVDSSGTEANEDSYVPQVSADGRYVVYASEASNLVANDTNGLIDVFRHDLQTGVTERVSLDNSGAQLVAASSNDPTISENGRFVVFSSADNALPNANGSRQIYIRDTTLSTTTLVSASDGTSTAGDSHSQCPIIGGTEATPLVSFLSRATDLVAGDTNDAYDVFVRDVNAGTTTRVSVDSSGNEANGHSAFNSIDESGRVVFASIASNLDPDDTDTTPDAYLYDSGTVTLLSRANGVAGTKGDSDTDMVAVHYDGVGAAIRSTASNLDTSDTTHDDDLYLRDLSGHTISLTSGSFPETPNFLYAADPASEVIYVYSLNNDGTLTPGTNLSLTGDGPTELAVNPRGTFLEVTNLSTSLFKNFQIDLSSGSLTQAESTSPESGLAVVAAADPSGRFAHALNDQGGIEGFIIDPATGTFSRTNPSSGAAGSGAARIAYGAEGCYVFVCNQTDQTVSAFSMSDAGSLSEVPGSPFATAINQPVALAVHPDGDALYVGCNGGGTGIVEAFSIEATTGALTSLGSQVVSSGGVRDVVIEPRGGFVYSINATNSIHRLAVNADKTLGLSTAFTVDSSTNAAPARLVVDPSGAFLYVTGQATDQIYSFDLNATTGALTTLEVVPTGGTGASLAGLAVASPVLPAWGYGVGPQLASISLEEEVGLLNAMECELAAPGVFSNGLTLDIRRFLRDWFSATTSVATVSTVGRVTGVSTGSVDLSAVEKVTGTRPLLAATVVDHINLRGSTTTAGDEPDDESDWPALSSDGRFLVFISLATDLTSGVGNDAYDVYLYDFKTNTNQRISLDTGGGDPNGDSDVPVISGDGRYIVYESDASDLVSGDANGEQDIFLYDRVNQTTRRITVNTSGGDPDGRSSDARITPDGRYITFESEATNLVSGDGNGFQDCFVYDRINDTIERVSVAAGGGDSDGRSTNSDISEDGNLVVFDSEATNLLSTTDGNALKDIFLYNRTTGVTTRISEASGGGDPDGLSNHPRISKDGAFVAFESEATNLVSGDTNAVTDIYLVEVASGTTTRVSLSDAGVEPDSDCLNPNVSSDGGLVAFETDATTLVTGATGDCIPYLYDRTAGTLSQAVFSAAGGFPEDNTFCSTLSYDGRFLAFVSFANNLRAGDSGQLNVYVTPLRCLP